MKVYLGPAGIPGSTEEKTTLNGLMKVSELKLNAMEVEFVRSIYLNRKAAEEVGDLAKQLKIQLTVHAPYFINLLSEKKDVVESSKKRVLDSLDKAEAMNAEAVVVHAAYYGKLSEEEAFNKMREITLSILDKGFKPKLAYETMAKKTQFADLDTLLKLINEVKSNRLTACVDFAHLFVRENGKINYGEILNKLKEFTHIYSHFSNVKYNVKTKKFMDVHEPINNHPPFKPLAEEILKRKINITIISESPILELDSLKMKKILQDLGLKT
ncbi:MAG: TIM barrel protein [Candidatus Bathyarchaeia archaeon]|nr:TIM barrel protein [Candidatus Bathyarchaeota archaeon]